MTLNELKPAAKKVKRNRVGRGMLLETEKLLEEVIKDKKQEVVEE